MIYVLIAFFVILIIGVLVGQPPPKFISVALIVKNEEKFLRQCLESLDKIPNKEIVLVDTGSTDKTKEIASEFTDRIYDYKWTGHFAEARNFGIEKCEGEYILIIDGDETLEKWDEPHGEFSMIQVNNKSQGIVTPHWSVRLFKNYRGYKYHYRVHEKLEPSLRGIIGHANYSIIKHHGYEYSDEEKKKHTEELLEAHWKQLTEEQDNPSVNYHIALCLYALGHYIEARDFSALALHDAINNEVKAYLCINIYLTMQKTGQEDLGGYWLKHSLKYCDKQVQGRLLLADYLGKRGKGDMGLEQFKIIEQIIKNRETRLPNDLVMTLAQLEKIKGDYTDAIQHRGN